MASSQYAKGVLLAAKASGKEVTMEGSNNCNVWGDSETARNLFLK
ncbi:MAG: hypothetical protein OQL19_02285 [Gammaproteobacteria bacterium]|nr:hypothetical protein [Gammaproteobacteria bacterium]